MLDPLLVLGAAATVTDRIRLGTNVLVAPWYPPILLARSLTTLDHLSGGRLTVGFGVGWSVLRAMWSGLRDRAAEHGRDPDDLRLVVRANVALSDRPLADADRPVFCGSIDQIRDDVRATREIGADELVFDLHDAARSAAELVELAEALGSADREPAGVG